MVQKAQKLAVKASQKEKDLIDALSVRYPPKPVKDRSSLDGNFAKAMAQVYATYPEDPDIAVLYAEALMDQHPLKPVWIRR